MVVGDADSDVPLVALAGRPVISVEGTHDLCCRPSCAALIIITQGFLSHSDNTSSFSREREYSA
jgi:hypothetical protein